MLLMLLQPLLLLQPVLLLLPLLLPVLQLLLHLLRGAPLGGDITP